MCTNDSFGIILVVKVDIMALKLDKQHRQAKNLTDVAVVITMLCKLLGLYFSSYLIWSYVYLVCCWPLIFDLYCCYIRESSWGKQFVLSRQYLCQIFCRSNSVHYNSIHNFCDNFDIFHLSSIYLYIASHECKHLQPHLSQYYITQS